MQGGNWAERTPDKTALILAETGETRSYAELDAAADRCAQFFRARGLQVGDGIALCVENCLEFIEICQGAHRAGLYYTAISTYLTADETRYIAEDCGAKLLTFSASYADRAEAVAAGLPETVARYSLGGDIRGYERLEPEVAAMPAEPLPDATSGQDLLYSSGTTGRPKGVKAPLSGRPVHEPAPNAYAVAALYGIDENMVYLSPAPLYHAAPLRYNMLALMVGATSVVMRKFDPERALAMIEKYRCTHSQWVPTMFVRMLKLPREVRERYDVSSMRVAIHAAAPCPVPVKERMIEWWGLVIYEYYAGSENNGFCAISPEEWLTHKGSVGRPLYGELHIVGEDGEELPPGETGLVYFGGASEFEYLNDPEKTRSAYNERGWSTLGDVGYVDEEGYLYLTDRKAYTIISGGVNIYPQEAENLLITHPGVADVAVFGVPEPEMGEEVKAVVQPQDPAAAGPALEAELIEWCRERLSHIKCPRTIDFMEELPRHPTGKLYKRLLRDRYWQDQREET